MCHFPVRDVEEPESIPIIQYLSSIVGYGFTINDYWPWLTILTYHTLIYQRVSYIHPILNHYSPKH